MYNTFKHKRILMRLLGGMVVANDAQMTQLSIMKGILP